MCGRNRTISGNDGTYHGNESGSDERMWAGIQRRYYNFQYVYSICRIRSCIPDRQNKATDDIVHGLNKAVAVKTAALTRRVGGEEKYMMTGGVSKNKGLVKTLEEKLGTKLVISDKAQLCGALGAALFAADMADV